MCRAAVCPAARLHCIIPSIIYSDPAVHYFLTTFPYSLPCIVSMLLYMLSAVVVLLCLPETLTKRKLVSVAYIVNLIKCKFILHVVRIANQSIHH